MIQFNYGNNYFYNYQSMIGSHQLYEAAILLDVIHNMLFDLILTKQLIILGILSKFNLSIKETNSLTYRVHLKVN